MSKKKATMTLKDFHGGSIPSDLPLPSAPGVVVRPSDRPGLDRQVAAWGNPMGRSDHRLRPGSAGAVRNFDNKAPFLGPAAHIGRNFDEDERKPLDGGWGPRRTVCDDSIQVLPVRAELKPEYSWSGPLPVAHMSDSSASLEVKPDFSWSGPLPVAHMSNSAASSYAGRVSEPTPARVDTQNFGGQSSYSPRFVEAANVGLNTSNSGGNSGQGHPNAWAMRKEAVKATEPVAATWSGPNAAAKLAHASALEKVSSGRWQSKQVIYHLPDVEVIRENPIESQFGYKDDGFYSRIRYHQVDMGGVVEYHDEMLARHAQRSLTVDGGTLGVGEFPIREGIRTPMSPKKLESNPPRYLPEVQPTHNDGKFGGLELRSERPKLELHLRSKPSESLESPVDYKKGYQQVRNSGHPENVPVSYGNVNPSNSELSRPSSGNQAVERPKLNLKPRSQPLDLLEENIETKRNTVFGGARPRELVLKERGIDDVAIIYPDVGQPPNRVKHEIPKTDRVPTQSTPTRHEEKPENSPIDNRIRKNNDRRDNRVDAERTDTQRRNWRSENHHQRDNREIEKNHPQERPPSPETWRKPAEKPKTKAASAVELAQAFSRSVSDAKKPDLFPGQRGGGPNRGAVPFSRLMDSTARPQINGY